MDSVALGEHIKNAATIFTSFYSIYELFNNTNLHCSNKLIITFCIIDTLAIGRRRIDMTLHHVFTATLALYGLLYYNNFPEGIQISRRIIYAEISSVFLIANKYIMRRDNSIAPALNFFLFFCSFLYYRLINYYNIFFIEDLYRMPIAVGAEPPPTTIVVLHYMSFASLVGLFLINIYWFTIICKKVCKNVVFRREWSEFILSYTYFCAIPAVLYYYTEQWTQFPPSRWYMYIDLFGIVTLSVCSHQYHASIYKTLTSTTKYTHDVNLIDDDHVAVYVNDISAIHLRSFLCLYSTLMAISHEWTIFIVMMSCFAHLEMFKYFVNFITQCLKKERIISYNCLNGATRGHENMVATIRGAHYYIKFPLIFDIVISAVIMLYRNNRTYFINSLTLTYIMFCIVTIKPFYNMNHVILHTFLIIQAAVFAAGIVGNQASI